MLQTYKTYSPWGCKESDTTEQLSTAQCWFQFQTQILEFWEIFESFFWLSFFPAFFFFLELLTICWILCIDTLICISFPYFHYFSLHFLRESWNLRHILNIFYFSSYFVMSFKNFSFIYFSLNCFPFLISKVSLVSEDSIVYLHFLFSALSPVSSFVRGFLPMSGNLWLTVHIWE